MAGILGQARLEACLPEVALRLPALILRLNLNLNLNLSLLRPHDPGAGILHLPDGFVNVTGFQVHPAAA
ncbi:MAG: hypothetical protein J5I98_16630, partial [Phaeodactylibacter sp.]|nr:hypothetical protein [Phaeodactylibacter sp.]